MTLTCRIFLNYEDTVILDFTEIMSVWPNSPVINGLDHKLVEVTVSLLYHSRALCNLFKV